MDVGELAPTLQQKQWHSVLTVLRADGRLLQAAPYGPMATRVAQYMAFDRGQPQQPRRTASPAPARTPAASAENISAEMWECLNTLYWFMKSDEARARSRVARRLLPATS
jgi:uncharacterized alpha-E superfamily protein